MSKEIIVYLDEYKYSGDGNYDIMYLDFRTASDYEKYLRALGIKERTRGSFLEIKGYRSPKRLMQGCYYALNVDMLKQLTPEPHPESLILSQTYSLANYQVRNDGNAVLLQSHEPLDPMDLRVSYNNQISDINELQYNFDLSFRVNNVSQANWNELLQEEHVKVVYDVGAPIYASAEEVRSYIDTYASLYSETHPCLILSHWDKDHYHCLLGMTDAEINNFSKFICVDKMQTNMSIELFKRIESILGKNRLYCIVPPAKRPERSNHKMINIFENGTLGLYVGVNSRNINYSGIVLFAQGEKGNVVFSGDCKPVQANHVLLQQLANKGYPVCEHFLVVPHHGGDFKAKSHKIYHIPSSTMPISAIISVDESNNSYGHPQKEIVNWLQSIAPWVVKRTDKVGIIKYDL